MFRNASSPEWAVLFATALLLVMDGLGQAKAQTSAAPVPPAQGQAGPLAAAAARAQPARAAAEWVKNNPPGRTTAENQPVVKDNMHPRVSREEREQSGLPAPTWAAAHGKVQPAVRAALDEQRRLIDSGDPMVDFQWDRPAGFQGTAYVDIYLRHEPKGKAASDENRAAVAAVQTQILRKLSAAEFALVFQFKNAAGLVGYIDDGGLAKLADDPEVVAIGLDDQARPEDWPIAMDERGGKFVRGQQRGKVDEVVHEALAKSTDGYVYVITGLISVPLPEGPFWEAYRTQEAAARKIEERVLSRLTADEFRTRSRGGGLLTGYAGAAALEKLNVDPEVQGVQLDQPIRFPGDAGRRKP